MIIVQLMGGLGNQLQQYAFYKELESLGIDVSMDDFWFDEDNQKGLLAPRRLELKDLGGISYKRATKKDIYALIGDENYIGKIRRHLLPFTIHKFEENGRIYVESLVEDIKSGRVSDLYIQGYFACEFYYKDILGRLREEIFFPKESCSNPLELEKIADDMKKTESVGVHLRRGDYLDSENQMLFGNICTDSYYINSISYLKEKIRKAHGDNTEGEDIRFYIFSDDMSYAHDFSLKMRTLNPDLVFEVVEANINNPNFWDIYLMSRCKHNITANSTFSFWGARLNANKDKIMLRPAKHRNDHPFVLEDMKRWWSGWVFVDPEGNIFE